jgi:hypothetical protein
MVTDNRELTPTLGKEYNKVDTVHGICKGFLDFSSWAPKRLFVTQILGCLQLGKYFQSSSCIIFTGLCHMIFQRDANV